MSKTVVQESNGARVEFSISPAAPANISQGDRCIAFLRGGPVFPQDRPGAPDQPKNVCKACWGGPGQNKNVCKTCWGGPRASQKRMQNMPGRAWDQQTNVCKSCWGGPGPAENVCKACSGELFSRQGVGDLRGGKVWSKWAAPPANQRGIVNSVGWRGAPRGWTTRLAREEQKTTHFGQPPRSTCSANRVWETFAAARCGPNGRRPPPTSAE